MQDAVTYTVDDAGICTLTLDLPGRSMNVLGAELQPALSRAVDRALGDPAVKGIMITSGKSSFVAGADLNALEQSTDYSGRPMEQVVDENMTLSRDLRRMETGGKPVACALNGTALGGGFEIALACHYRVAADDPTLQLGLPEVNVGLIPGGGGTQRVLRMLGVRAAAELLMQGSLLSPAAALKAGLINRIVPKDAVCSEAKRWLMEQGRAVAPWDEQGFKVPHGSGPLEADFRNFFSVSNAMTRAKTFGNYPAAVAIASCLYEGAQLPMDLALRIEAKYFTRIYLGSVSKALMRTLFVNKTKASKLVARPAGVPQSKHELIGVVGAGTMGAGIALCAAKSGLRVVLLDRDKAAAEKGKDYARTRLMRDVQKGRLDEARAHQTLELISASSAYVDLQGASAVVESVFEDPDVKASVLQQIEAVVSATTVIGSNTSGLLITGLAGACKHPERFIGMHFFSPAERMPLIEIIRGNKTARATLAQTLDLAQQLNKTPIVVNDGPNFFTSRFIGAFISQSLDLIQEGVRPALVENGARMLGMPMGALAISDAIGLDLSYHAGVQQAKRRGEAPMLGVIGHLVAELGRHGRKNGKGFYDYGADGSQRLWPGLSDLCPPLGVQPSVDDVKARILYAQLAEGARCFSEGILASAMDGDLGAILGVGFPAYLGGPYTAMDNIGIAKVVQTCDRLTQQHGQQFAVPALLREMARTGATFFGPKAMPSPGALTD